MTAMESEAARPDSICSQETSGNVQRQVCQLAARL